MKGAPPVSPPHAHRSDDLGPGMLSNVLLRLPALILGLDRDGRIGFWNHECQTVLGYRPEEVGREPATLDRLVPAASERDRFLAWWHATEPPGDNPLEMELVGARGERRTISWQRLAVTEVSGLGTLCIGHDLTLQRRTERELRESRERLRTAFENVPLDFWIMNADGRYAMVNPAAVSRWGDHTGKTVEDATVPPTVREHWRAINARAFAGETLRGEVEYATDGAPRAYEYVVAPIRHPDGRVSGILGVNIDITERKTAERARAASEATKDAILDALPDLMFHMSSDGRYLDYHAPVSFPLLASPEQFIGRRVDEVIAKDLADLCMQCIARTLAEGGVQRYTYSVGKDPTRDYEVRMTPCARDEVVVLIRNISEIRQTEQSLRESEARYRSLFESSPLGLFVIQDGHVVMANPASLTILGAPDTAAVLGLDAMTFVADADRSAASGCVAAALLHGRSPPRVENLRRLDGTEVTVEAAGARIELGGRSAVQVTAQDITQRLLNQEALGRADEKLRQSQKMEAVGQLAAGVAHDFNNLLTAIFGYVALARSTLDPTAPAWTALDGVQAAAEQASGVIRSLLTVSRKAVTQFKPLDLVRVVTGSLELLRAGLPSSIGVEFSAPPNPVPVRGDEALLRQVVINLALNARDAMPRGGTLRVLVQGADSGGTASVRVEDTGHGVPEDLLPRIFEPFFTTKNRDSNSGLGLSIAEGIVRSHAGTIEVGAAPGGGAAFTVRLPAQPAEESTPGRAPSTAAPSRVLVVDENRQVREILSSSLSRAGYMVHHASSAESVARALTLSDPPVRAAIVNLDMLDGPECARRIAASRLPVRLISLTAAEHESTAPGIVLRKPFQVAQIPELVRRALEDHGGPAPEGSTA